jgi:hypothetical protein
MPLLVEWFFSIPLFSMIPYPERGRIMLAFTFIISMAKIKLPVKVIDCMHYLMDHGIDYAAIGPVMPEYIDMDQVRVGPVIVSVYSG